jgi:hypothetical protein
MTIARRLLVLAWVLASSVRAYAASPVDCLKRYATDLAHLDADDRRLVMRSVKSYDRTARDGVELLLQYRDGAGTEDGMERVAQLLRNFRQELSVPNPFPSDRELMAAAARVDQLNPGVLKIGRVLSDLGQDNHLGLAQAAAFDLFMADEATRTGLGVAEFQSVLSAGGVSRVYDARTLTGKFFENKSLVRPYDIAAGELTAPPVSPDGLFFIYQDDRLNSLGNETARSIVLHAGDGYTLFQTNFRNLPQMVGQRADIEAVMLKQFESGLVRGALDPTTLQNARATFAAQLAVILQFK